jgi:hypothetical protein
MGRVELLEPILADGIFNTNFFNGRLLSAEDLRTEQDAARARLAQVGRAAGAGIVAGLWVDSVTTSAAAGSAAGALVSVAAGLAVNRAGQTLALPDDTEVALVRADDAGEGSTDDAGLFKTCVPPVTSTVLTGAGVYVLALTPASGYDGKAQASGLTDVAAGRCCGAKFAVAGVQFKFARLDVTTNKFIEEETRARLLTLMRAGDAVSLSLLRNELAYLCFGEAAFDTLARDPFMLGGDGAQAGAGDLGVLADLYAANDLTDCDVPLALVYWSRNGIEFIDAWSVRRRVTHAPLSDRWSEIEDDPRASAGEATFRQFQDQLERLRRTDAPQQVSAREYFRYLPPVGIVPVAPAKSFSPRRFVYPKFFDGITCRAPVHLEGARLGALVRHASSFAAHDLDSRQMLWLYWVRQNTKSIAERSSSARYYLVFTSGHVPFAGEASYDISLLDYSNYV